MEGSDAELLAAGGDILGSQHGGIGRGLIAVGLDLHTTGNTADGFTATGITRVSLQTFLSISTLRRFLLDGEGSCSRGYVREIGDVDEGIVERGEDTSNAKDELTCQHELAVAPAIAREAVRLGDVAKLWFLPSRTWGPREMFSWPGFVVVRLGGIFACLVGRLVIRMKEGGGNGEVVVGWAEFFFSKPRAASISQCGMWQKTPGPL